MPLGKALDSLAHMTKRAVIYTRVSKDRETETSTATQEAEARDLCARRGWEVVTVEVDQGRSAFKADTKRPALERCLKMVDRGAADVLVVWRLDRLHRGLVDFFGTWSRIDQAGGELASVTDDLDTTRAAGKMMVSLIAGFAEMESEAKSDRALAWHASRRSKALPPIGPRPFGYDRQDSTLVVRPGEADIVRDAAARVLAGESLRSVARAHGMTHRGLRVVLGSATTSGRREIEGVLVEGTWPAILDARTSDELRELFSDPTRRVGPGNDRRWMLSGLASCECGGPLQSKPHAAGPRYACRDCHTSIAAAALDDFVRDAIFAAVDRETWAAARSAGRAPSIDTEALGSRLQEIAVDYAAGRVDRVVYEAAKAEQARLIAEAQAEPVELPALDDLQAGWDDLEVADRMLVVSAFLDGVTLRRGARNQRGSVADRVGLAWRV